MSVGYGDMSNSIQIFDMVYLNNLFESRPGAIRNFLARILQHTCWIISSFRIIKIMLYPRLPGKIYGRYGRYGRYGSVCAAKAPVLSGTAKLKKGTIISTNPTPHRGHRNTEAFASVAKKVHAM